MFIGKVASFRFIAAIHAFLMHTFFGRIKKVLFGFWVTAVVSPAPRHFVLQKEINIHQIFHLLNKKILKKQKQKISRDLSLSRINNFEKPYLKK